MRTSCLANWLLKFTVRSYRVPVLACLTSWAAYELKSWAVAAVLVFIGLIIDSIFLMMEEQFGMIKLLHKASELANKVHQQMDSDLDDHEQRITELKEKIDTLPGD